MYGTVVIRGTGPDDLCKGKGGGDSAFSYTGNFWQEYVVFQSSAPIMPV